ncbi:hypothetical protein [Tichowtungia aerotolerans]|uniref:Uncharacterized protein n=1 Tax=Tichowtungia aerotolerans TaxID=2697043 RepID=A0A6P1M8G2_9BACT|nr:hypothetical protein [Tichowtungia aerotolerans]QHI68814.1 hypothetical protein GT409_04905 [Tichowtungia aerotolerans]
MASVNEWIVREYFETLGFFVIQPNKHQVVARHKHDVEEIDLLITRPGQAGVFNSPKEVVWNSGNLADVQRAVVSIRGWHTDRFSPATLRQNPEIFRFTELSVIQEARKILGPGSIVRILCVSDLTATADLYDETLAMMRKNGVDGVLSFRTMLLELIDHLDTVKNYEKSDLLQILRILKTYDLLKDSQMELFEGRKK